MMNRRDFLSFGRSADQRVMELSCQQLYMQAFERRLMAEPSAADVGESSDPAASDEPPSRFDQATEEELFADLERRLHDVDVLRLVDVEWLAGADFRARVEALCTALRARGGRVERSIGRDSQG